VIHQYAVLQSIVFRTFIKSCKQQHNNQQYKYDKLLDKLLEFKLKISKLYCIYSFKRFLYIYFLSKNIFYLMYIVYICFVCVCVCVCVCVSKYTF